MRRTRTEPARASGRLPDGEIRRGTLRRRLTLGAWKRGANQLTMDGTVFISRISGRLLRLDAVVVGVGREIVGVSVVLMTVVRSDRHDSAHRTLRLRRDALVLGGRVLVNHALR